MFLNCTYWNMQVHDQIRGGKYAPQRKLAILAIFLHSLQQKWDEGTLGRQRSTLIGSRTRRGPSMDPAMALQYT